MRGLLFIRAEIIMRKTSGSLIVAVVFLVLGMTASAFGATRKMMGKR